jgi:hypothetical protein
MSETGLIIFVWLEGAVALAVAWRANALYARLRAAVGLLRRCEGELFRGTPVDLDVKRFLREVKL